MVEIMSEEIVEERIYTIPFYPKLNSIPRKQRTPRALRLLSEFVIRHMKANKVWVSPEVNERMWERGIEKPPRRIDVRLSKDAEGIVEVYLALPISETVVTPEVVSVPSELPDVIDDIDLEEEDAI
jgi:large subunit ribosomal protein L31e